MALALASGVAPGVWAEEGQRVIATAVELLERARRGGKPDDEGGPQMSG